MMSYRRFVSSRWLRPSFRISSTFGVASLRGNLNAGSSADVYTYWGSSDGGTSWSRVTKLFSSSGALVADAGMLAKAAVEGKLDIRADASLLTEITGWRPEIPLSTTLADVLAEAANAR